MARAPAWPEQRGPFVRAAIVADHGDWHVDQIDRELVPVLRRDIPPPLPGALPRSGFRRCPAAAPWNRRSCRAPRPPSPSCGGTGCTSTGSAPRGSRARLQGRDPGGVGAEGEQQNVVHQPPVFGRPGGPALPAVLRRSFPARPIGRGFHAGMVGRVVNFFPSSRHFFLTDRVSPRPRR